MDKMKSWIALAGLAAVAILAVGWLLLVSPKSAQADALRLEAEARRSSNQALEAQVQVLKAKAKDLPKKQADLARVAAKIPSGASLPTLIRTLTAASAEAGVELVSVTPGAPAAAGTGVVAPPAGTAPAAPAASAAPAAPGTPAAPASPAGGLTAIPLTLNVVGEYFDLADFVARLEGLPRAMRITNLTVAPGTSPTTVDATDGSGTREGRVLTSTITGSVFMMTTAPAAPAVVAPDQTARTATTAVAPAAAPN